MFEFASVKDMVYGYVERLDEGTTFSPRDIIAEMFLVTGGRRNPMDSTVTRILRKRRAEKNDVRVANRNKALYIKETNNV